MSREWAIKPIPLSFGQKAFNEYTGEQIQKRENVLSNFPLYAKDRKDIQYGTPFKPEDSQQWAWGMMNVHTAVWENMANSYPSGYIADNIASHKQRASVMQPITGYQNRKGYEMFDDSMMAFKPEAQKLIDGYAEGTAWNMLRLGNDYGRNPIAFNTGTDRREALGGTLTNETPEDLFLDEPPPGWNIKEALEQLSEINPVAWDTYKLVMGSEEKIHEIAEGSKTPGEVLYKLNNYVQSAAIMNSLDKNFEQMSWGEEMWALYGRGLIVNGIINDPDMPASLTVSLGLAPFTWGGSLLLGLGAKLLKASVSSIKWGKRLSRLAKIAGGTGAVVSHLAKVRHVLPETVGPTVMKKMFKNYDKWKGADEFWSWRQFSVNRLGDATEGSITGGFAEYSTQRYDKHYGLRDDIDMKGVLKESLVEAALSPIINPAVGGVHRAILGGPLYVANKTMIEYIPETFSKGLTENFKSLMQNFDPDQTAKMWTTTKKFVQLGEDISELTMDDVDPAALQDSSHMLNLVLEGVMNHTNVDRVEVMNTLSTVVGKIKAGVNTGDVAKDSLLGAMIESNKENFGGEGKLSLDQMAFLLADELSRKKGKNGQPNPYGINNTKFLLELEEKLAHFKNLSAFAKENGLSIEEAKKKIEDEGLFIEVYPGLKEEIVEQIGVDEYERLKETDEGKLKLSGIALDIFKEKEKQFQETVKAKRERVAEAQVEAEDAVAENENIYLDDEDIPEDVSLKELEQLKEWVENPGDATVTQIDVNINTYLEQGLINEVQANMLKKMTLEVSQGKREIQTLTAFENQIYEALPADAYVVTLIEWPSKNWLNAAYKLSKAGVPFHNRLAELRGEAQATTSERKTHEIISVDEHDNGADIKFRNDAGDILNLSIEVFDHAVMIDGVPEYGKMIEGHFSAEDQTKIDTMSGDPFTVLNTVGEQLLLYAKKFDVDFVRIMSQQGETETRKPGGPSARARIYQRMLNRIVGEVKPISSDEATGTFVYRYSDILEAQKRTAGEGESKDKEEVPEIIIPASRQEAIAKIEDYIKDFRENFSLSEDGSEYIDNAGNIFERVSSVIEEQIGEIDPEAAALKMGTLIDDVARDYITNPDEATKPEGWSDEAWEQFKDVWDPIIQQWKDEGRWYTAEETTFGSLDAGGSGRSIAGTTDILTITEDGKVEIFDIKTSKYDTSEWDTEFGDRLSKSERYSKQLSLYATLVEEALGLEVAEITAIPLELNYNETDLIPISITKNNNVGLRLLNNIRITNGGLVSRGTDARKSPLSTPAPEETEEDAPTDFQKWQDRLDTSITKTQKTIHDLTEENKSEDIPEEKKEKNIDIIKKLKESLKRLDSARRKYKKEIAEWEALDEITPRIKDLHKKMLTFEKELKDAERILYNNPEYIYIVELHKALGSGQTHIQGLIRHTWDKEAADNLTRNQWIKQRREALIAEQETEETKKTDDEIETQIKEEAKEFEREVTLDAIIEEGFRPSLALMLDNIPEESLINVDDEGNPVSNKNIITQLQSLLAIEKDPDPSEFSNMTKLKEAILSLPDVEVTKTELNKMNRGELNELYIKLKKKADRSGKVISRTVLLQAHQEADAKLTQMGLDIQGTEAFINLLEAKDKLEQASTEYNITKSALQDEATKTRGMALRSIGDWQELLAVQAVLKRYIDSSIALVENGEVQTARDIRDIAPAGSRLRKEINKIILEMENDEGPTNNDLDAAREKAKTLEDVSWEDAINGILHKLPWSFITDRAVSILDSDLETGAETKRKNWILNGLEQERTRISNLSPEQMWRTQVPRNLQYLAKTKLHQMSEQDWLTVEAADITGRDIELYDKKIFGAEAAAKELEALEIISNHLNDRRSGLNPDQPIRSAEIRKWAENTAYGEWAVSPSVLFKQAISKEHEIDLNKITDDELANLEVEITFDADLLVDVIRNLLEESLVYNSYFGRKIPSRLRKATVGETLKSLSLKRNKDGYFPAKEARRHIKDMYDAVLPILRERADEFGFVYEVNENTLWPSESSGPLEGLSPADRGKAEAKYENVARNAMIKRILKYLSKTGTRTLVDNIMEEVGYIKEKDVTNQQLAMILADKILLAIPSITEDNWTISSFGDGTVDWQPAKDAGEGLVDYFSMKSLVTKRHKVSIIQYDDGRFGIEVNGILDTDEHESTAILALTKGQGNMLALIPLYERLSIAENSRTRFRIEKITNIINAPEEVQAQYRKEWEEKIRNTKVEAALPEGAGVMIRIPDKRNPIYSGAIPTEDKLAAHFFPNLLLQTTEEEFLTREEILDAGMYYMLDLPNLSRAYIQDSVTYSAKAKKNRRLSAEVPTHVQITEEVITKDGIERKKVTGISMGSDFILPPHEILVNAIWENIGGSYQNVFDLAMESYEITRNHLIEKHGEEAFTKGKMWNRDVMHDDRKSSVWWEFMMMAGALNPKVQKTIDTIRQQLANKTYGGENFKQNLDDLYIESGIYVVGSIFDAPQHKDRSLSIPSFMSIFNNLQNIKDRTDWDRIYEAADTDQQKQMDVIRDFFKIPALRTMYTGGMKAFLSTFEGEKEEGTKWLQSASEVFGINIKDLRAELENLSKILYENSYIETGILMENALGMDEEIRSEVLKFMETKQDESELIKKSKDILQAVSRDPENINNIIGLNGILEVMEASVAHWVELAYPEGATPANMKKAKKRLVNDPLEKSKRYLTKLKAKGIAIPSGMKDEHWQFLHELWLPKEFKSWQHMDLFKMWNIMLSGAWQINAKNISQVAKTYGIMDYKLEHLMGLPEQNIYLRQRPQDTAQRAFDEYGILPNNKGIRFDRAEVDADKLAIYVEERKQSMNQAEFKKDPEYYFNQFILEYMEQDKDHRAALGAFDLVDSPMHKIYRDAKKEGATDKQAWDKVRAELDKMLWYEEMLTWSEKYPLPFEDYTIEDSNAEFYSHFMNSWNQSWEERAGTLPAELQQEKQARKEMNDKPWRKEFIEGRVKMGRSLVVDPKRPHINPYAVVEYDDAVASKYDHPLTVDSENSKGPISFIPKMNNYSFANRGMMGLELALRTRKLNERMDPIEQVLANTNETLSTKEGAEEVIKPYLEGRKPSIAAPESALGRISPWNLNTIPEPLPPIPQYIVEEALELDDTRLGQEVGRFYQRITEYARSIGMEDELDNPEAWPFLNYMLRTQNVIKRNLQFTKRGASKTLGETLAIRSRFKEDFLEISQLSRDLREETRDVMDLETPGKPLGIHKPPVDMTLGEFLGSKPTSMTDPTPLIDHTLLWDQLDFTVPEESVVDQATLIDEQGNEHPIESKTSQFLTNINFNKDFIKYAVSSLLTEAYGVEEIRKFKDGKYASLVEPGSENLDNYFDIIDQFSLEDLRELLYNIKNGAKESPVYLHMDLRLIRELGEASPEKRKEMADHLFVGIENAELATTNEKTGIRHKFKHREGGIYSGMHAWLAVPSRVKGDTARLRITPEGLIRMVMTLTNSDLLWRAQMSAISGRSLGVDVDFDGAPISTVATSRLVRENEGANNVRRIRKRSIQETTALDIIMGKTETGKPQLRTVTSGRSTIRSAAVRHVNYGDYHHPRHKGRLQNFVIDEVYYGIANGLVTQINTLGNGDLNTAVDKVQEYIHKARMGEAHEKNVIDILALTVLANSDGNNFHQIDVDTLTAFLYNEEIGNPDSTKVITAARNEAYELYRNLQSLISKDEHVWSGNDYDALAADFVYKLAAKEYQYPDNPKLNMTAEEMVDQMYEDFFKRVDQEAPLRIDATEVIVDVMQNLGMSQEDALKMPEVVNYQEWLADTNKTYQLDIETDHTNENIISIGIKEGSKETRYVGNSSEFLSQKQALAILKAIEKNQQDGYKVSAYNGISFDWRILGKVAGDHNLAARIALRSIDPFENLRSFKSRNKGVGYHAWHGLEAVAERLAKKPWEKSMDGLEAYLYWLRGQGIEINKESVMKYNIDLDKIKNLKEHKGKGNSAVFKYYNDIEPSDATTKLKKYTKEDVDILNEVYHALNKKTNQQDRTSHIGEYSVTIDQMYPTWFLDARRDLEYKGLGEEKLFFAEWDSTIKEQILELSGNMRKSNFSNVIANGDIRKNKDLALAALHKAIGREEEAEINSVSEWIDSKVKHEFKDIATASAANDHLYKYEEIHRGQLRDIFDHINELVTTHEALTEHDAMLMRDLVLRIYHVNPFNILDLHIVNQINEEKGVPVSGAMKTEEGKFEIRIGKGFVDIQEIGGGRAPLIFAHELGHVGRLKWIESNRKEWRQYRDIMHSDGGKEFIKAMVQAFNEGRWDAKAEKEYERYTTDVEEFMAAMYGYYMLEGQLPAYTEYLDSTKGKKALPPGYHDAEDKSWSILRRIFDFVLNRLQRVANVFRVFRHQHPEAAEVSEKLIQRMLGWSADNTALIQYASDVPTGELMFMEPRFPQVEEKAPVYDDAFIIEAWQRMKTLEAKAATTTGLTKEENHEYGEIVRLINSDEMSTPDELNTTRWERVTVMSDIMDRDMLDPESKSMFGTDAAMSLPDLFYVLHTVNEETLTPATALERRVLASHILRTTKKEFGYQVNNSAGEAMRAAGKFLSKMGQKLGIADSEEAISQLMTDVLVGNTGANYTFNSLFTIPIMLTSLLESKVAGMSGNYTNIFGQRDISGSLRQLETWSSAIGAITNEIIIEVGGTIDKIAGKIVSEGNKNIMADISFKILQAVQGEMDTKDYLKTWELDIPELADTEVPAKALEIARLLHNQLTFFQAEGTALGMFSKFMHAIPMQLQNSIWTEGEVGKGYTTLRTEMRNEVQKRIEDPINSSLVEPTLVYAANFLPDLDQEGMADWFESIAINNPSQLLMGDLVATRALQYLKQIGTKDWVTRDQVTALTARIRAGEHKVVAAVRVATKSIMDGFGEKRIDWEFLKRQQDRSADYAGAYKGLKDRYSAILDSENYSTETALSVKRKLAQLSSHSLGLGLEKYYFKSRKGSSVLPMNSDTPIDLITSTMLSRAAAGMYFVNDLWVVPNPVKIAENNPVIREHLVLDPVQLTEGMRRGVGNKIFEQQLVQDMFGVKGDFPLILDLFEKVFEDGVQLLNADGTVIDRAGSDTIAKSIEELRGKHDFVQGLQETPTTSSRVEEFIYNIAPSLTKIAFAVNMPIASYTFEGLMSSFIELVGKRNFTGLIRGILSPAWWATQSKAQKASKLRDIIRYTQAFNRAWIPEWDRPATQPNPGALEGFIQGWGEQMMRPAQWMHEAIAATRSEDYRNHLRGLLENGNNSKLARLVTAIENAQRSGAVIDYRTQQMVEGATAELETPDTLDELMKSREVNIPEGMRGIVRSLFNSGMLVRENFTLLQKMIEDSRKHFRSQNIDTFSPAEMLSHASALYDLRNSTGSSKGDSQLDKFKNRLLIIQALSSAEQDYIQEVMVSPNAFDVTTRRGIGLGGFLYEIFRRFPVLFICQHILRKAKHNSLARLGLMVVGMLILDTIYMIALRAAMGMPLEDLLEEFEKNPASFLGKLAARWPIWGRYGQIIAEVISQISGNISSSPGSMIPAGALATTLNQALKALKSGIIAPASGEDVNWQDIVNSTRLIPLVGDTFLRLIFYQTLGQGIERKKMGGGTRSSREAEPNTEHVGATVGSLMYNWEAITEALLEEVAVEEPLGLPYYPGNPSMNMFQPDPTPVKQPLDSQPPLPPQTDMPISQPEPVAPIMDRLEEAAGAAGGTELADRLGG